MDGKRSGGEAAKLLFVMLVAAVLLNADPVEAQTAGQCKHERRLLVSYCKRVLAGRPPSAYCCQRVRVTPTSCVCSIITPQLAALIDINYAVKVVRGCGRHVPSHFKCGSITTP